MTEIVIHGEITAQERAWVHSLALDALRSMDGFGLPGDSSPWLAWAFARPALPRATLRLRFVNSGLHVTLSSEEGFGPIYEALVPLTISDSLALALCRGLQEGLSATVAMAAADRAGPPALRALLDGGPRSPGNGDLGHHLQSFAVRRLAELRDQGAAPALRQLVWDGASWEATPAQQTLALKAVGSLIALCDQRAVVPMIALTRHKDDEFVVQMAHAVSAVGGPMAEAYLVTLATGHLQAEVRDGAAQALSELRQRQKVRAGCG